MYEINWQVGSTLKSVPLQFFLKKNVTRLYLIFLKRQTNDDVFIIVLSCSGRIGNTDEKVGSLK